ncbi:MAG: hypothetical protein AAF226_10165 [Verrucomicrobiota bacterium]
MADSFNSKYQRIARGFLGMSGVWMGESHLVHVRGRGVLVPFTEEYRRYRYSDIESISIAKKSRVGGMVGLLAGVIVLLALTLLFSAVRGDGGGGFALTILAAICGVSGVILIGLFLRHWLLGATCVCEIQTSLKRERISTLNRYSIAQQAVDLLRSEIANAQNGFLPRDGSERESVDASRNSKPLVVSGLHWVTCGIAGLFALLVLAGSFIEQMVIWVAVLITFLAFLALTMSSLFGSIRNRTPDSIRVLYSIFLVSCVVFGISSLVYYLIVSFQNPAYTLDMVGPFLAFTELPTYAGIGFVVLFLTVSVTTLILSGIGFLVGMKWRKWISRGERNDG